MIINKTHLDSYAKTTKLNQRLATKNPFFTKPKQGKFRTKPTFTM